jgi:hypothetical protein
MLCTIQPRPMPDMFSNTVSPATVCRNLRHFAQRTMPIPLLRDSGRRMVKSPSARFPMLRVFSSLGRAIGSRKPPMVNLSLGDTGRRWRPSIRPACWPGASDGESRYPWAQPWARWGFGKLRVPGLRSYYTLCVRAHNVPKYRNICGAAASPGNAIGSDIPGTRSDREARFKQDGKTQESVRRQGP